MADLQIEKKNNEFRCGRCLDLIGPGVVRVDNKECGCAYSNPKVEVRPPHMSDFISLKDFEELLHNGKLGNL